MKQIKLLMVAFLAMIGSSAYAKYIIDQRFTSVAELDGKLFTVVNEAESKALCFMENHNLNYEVYSTAMGSNSYYFIIEAVPETEYFYLRSRKPDGTEYAYYGGGGYLNSQPASGGVSFSLGLTDKKGQDIENGAVWALEVNDGKFAIKNIGTGLYLKNGGSAKYEEPTYFTFCTLVNNFDADEAKALVLSYYNLLNATGKAALESYVALDPIDEANYEAAKAAFEAQAAAGNLLKYYFYNVKAGKYWGAGNDWGTRASLVKNPEYVTLHIVGVNTYQMESQVSNGGTSYYFGGDYMDGGPVALTISEVEGGYTVANGTNFYGYDGSSTVLGKNLSSDDAKAIWQIFSEADMQAKLAAATAETPVDATWLILDPNFGRNNRNSGAWTFEASNKNISGGNNENNCAESFHAVFSLSQTIKNVPNGVYTLTAQGFYRQDGSDNTNLPVFYANDETATFPAKTGNEGSMSDASNSFTNGSYTISPIVFEVTDGKITLGAKNEVNTSLWCILDNFQLTYYGSETTVKEVKFGTLIAQVEALRATATAQVSNENVSSVTKTALNDALTTTETIAETVEAYNAAIATLTAATTQAQKDIDNKPAINAMKALMDATNVYTAEAFAAYKAICDDYEARWNDGTLTEIVVNPDVVQEWHASNQYDDFLLSAWTIGGTQCADFTTALYINTWSVEGNNDGTNFKVPFFEYWTADGNSLIANNLVATVSGLEEGTYKVDAWVRVRAKNGTDAAEATGITLKANDGEAVDVTEGEKVGTSQFNIGKYSAIATVAADGKLTITIAVAADNNISWLSYRDVKYTKLTEATLAVAAANEYATFVAPFDVTIPAGVKAYTVDGVTGAELNMTEVTTTIKANTPVVLQATTDVNEKFYGAAVAGDPEEGLLTGVYTDTPAPVGTYVLQNQGEGAKFYLVEAGKQPTVKAGHAYLTAPSAGVKAFGFDAIATAITELTEKTEATEGVIYNLQGQRVNTLQRGINIVNGKKVLVK